MKKTTTARILSTVAVTVLYAMIISSTVSCKRDYPSDGELSEYAGRINDVGSGLVDWLDDLFQVNMCLEAEDSAARDSILAMYFGRSADTVLLDGDGDVVYMARQWMDYTINTGGRTLSEDGAVWNVSYRWFKPWGDSESFEINIARKPDGRYAVEGMFLANGLWEYFIAYSQVNLEFTTSLTGVSYWAEGGAGSSVRNTVKYKFNGWIDTYYGDNGSPYEEMPQFNMSLTDVSAYNPKEYIGSEPVFSGKDYYLRGGSLECLVMAPGRSPGVMYIDVGAGGVWDMEWEPFAEG